MDAENDDDNKFTLMALSPVNLNEHKASESFGWASSIAQKKGKTSLFLITNILLKSMHQLLIK